MTLLFQGTSRMKFRRHLLRLIATHKYNVTQFTTDKSFTFRLNNIQLGN
jgi:hypothetical protein